MEVALGSLESRLQFLNHVRIYQLTGRQDMAATLSGRSAEPRSTHIPHRLNCGPQGLKGHTSSRRLKPYARMLGSERRLLLKESVPHQHCAVKPRKRAADLSA